MTSHQLAKFRCHKHSGDRDIIILDCYVTLQDHMIKGSKGHVTLWAEARQVKLPSCQVW